MSEVVRFGILSFAHDHAHAWAEAVNDTPEAALVSIWDDDVRRGRDAAARHGTRFQPDLSALLRGCDAVGITSETARHADLVEQAAAAGVHVLCEKPTATTIADCDRIARAIRAAGIVFMQNFPKRFDPVNRELVELVRREELGRIVLVRIRHGHAHGLDPTFRSRWYADPALGGGGTLIDEGIHAADFLRWLLGEPADVRATVSRRALGLPVEDTATATFTFASGAVAEVATGWTLLAAEQSVEVYGTAGVALLSGVDLASRDFATAPYLKVFRRGGADAAWEASPTVPFFQTGSFHQQGPRRFIAGLRAGEREPTVGLEDGRRALAMILAAYRAAGSGQTQPIAAEKESGR